MNTRQTMALQAAEALKEETSFRTHLVYFGFGAYDGRLIIHTKAGEIKLWVKVIRRADASQLIQLILSKKTEDEVILVSEQFSADLIKTLRQVPFNYLDTSGNCYIQSEGQLIFIEGRKAVVAKATKKKSISKSGLKLLFTLLTQPEAVNQTIRELAQQTSLSVGTVQQTLDSFIESGYIVSVDGKRRKLVQVELLRQQWINLYENTLKPSLLIGRFRLVGSIDSGDWRQVNLQNGSYWGGEPAADALTHNLRPSRLTIYTSEERMSLIKNYRLIPDPDGVVEVNELFWRPQESKYVDVPIVPPLLIYTDLLAKAEPRNLEIAHTIYEQYVQHKL